MDDLIFISIPDILMMHLNIYIEYNEIHRNTECTCSFRTLQNDIFEFSFSFDDVSRRYGSTMASHKIPHHWKHTSVKALQ